MREHPLELIIARHAKSSWRFADLDDFHRPLSKRGLRDVVRMPRMVAARVPAPDLLLSSDAVRAVQTSQALADGFGLDPAAVVLRHDMYLASAEDLLAVLAGDAGSAHRVLVVGHNPGLTELFNLLVGNPVENLPTLAVAHLALEVPAWDRVGPGCARSLRLLLPKELLKDG
jgi:phosphohistidine phosphatase